MPQSKVGLFPSFIEDIKYVVRNVYIYLMAVVAE